MPMSDLSRATAVPGGVPPTPAAGTQQHPSTFAPATFVFLVILCLFGAVIGVQLILQLGITPNTSIIGALVAMLLARLPGAIFARYRSIHVQNLAQSAISAATFGAANSLLLPIGVPFLLGRADLILPMLVGAALSMLLDGYLLYRMFDTRVFPAAGTWPPGVAAAEAIRAGDAGGRRAALLGIGLLVGIAGSWLKIPMSAFGVAFIGNVWALTMFGIGLLIRGYAMPVAGIDIAKLYVPHGAMVGAGLVALIQVALLIARRGTGDAIAAATDDRRMRRALGLGSLGYMAIAVLIAVMGGLIAELSPGMLVAFVVYAAFAAFVHELIVGISAMHAGWFPAFAVALITLIIGILLGFPPVALALLVGFSASTGPAFADMGYDLRAGYLCAARAPTRASNGRPQAAALRRDARLPDRDPDRLFRLSRLFFAGHGAPGRSRLRRDDQGRRDRRCRDGLADLGDPRRGHPASRRTVAAARHPACDGLADPEPDGRLGRPRRHRDTSRGIAFQGQGSNRLDGSLGRRLYRRRCAVRVFRLGYQDRAESKIGGVTCGSGFSAR
jgi:hypothetical protein